MEPQLPSTEVEKEVIREVPVEKIVEVEVVREVRLVPMQPFYVRCLCLCAICTSLVQSRRRLI